MESLWLANVLCLVLGAYLTIFRRLSSPGPMDECFPFAGLLLLLENIEGLRLALVMRTAVLHRKVSCAWRVLHNLCY